MATPVKLCKTLQEDITTSCVTLFLYEQDFYFQLQIRAPPAGSVLLIRPPFFGACGAP
jgi:hypothetical protein